MSSISSDNSSVHNVHCADSTSETSNAGNREERTVGDQPPVRKEREIKQRYGPRGPIGDNVIRRNFVESDALALELCKRFPGWEFKLGGGSRHPHPLGALERVVCEEMAYRYLTNEYNAVSINDVGGNANRHALAKRREVHSCNPILSPEDAVRRREEKYVRSANYCNNTAQECTVEVDAYLSVHSLYYLSRGDIMQLLAKSRKGVLVAVLHRFDEIYGSFHVVGDTAESHYHCEYVGDELTVVMQVAGNTAPYQHSAMAWLKQKVFYQNGMAMCWTGRDVGDSWIYEFVLVRDRVLTQSWVNQDHAELPMLVSVNNPNHYGPINGVRNFQDNRELTPVLEFLQMSNARIFSFGCLFGFRVFQNGSVASRVLIPKHLINEVAIIMVGLPRDQNSLQVCVRTMKRYVTKLSIPAPMKLDCVVYGSAVAFLKGLDAELSAFNNLCSIRNHGKYGAHSLMLQLKGVWNVEKYVKVGGIVAGVSLIVLATQHNRRNGGSFKSVVKTVLGATTTLVVGTALCSSQIYDMGRNHSINLTKTVYDNYRQSAVSKAFDATVQWVKGLPGYSSLHKLCFSREGSTISVPDVDSIERPQMYPNCVTFSNFIPVVPYNDIKNEVIAVNNRALMEVPKCDPAVFSLVTREEIVKLVGDLGRIPYESEFIEFERWNSNYDKVKQKRHQLAYQNLNTTGWETKYGLRKSFVKREVTLLKTAEYGETFEDFDPRLIQGVSDEANVALGPFISLVSKRLSEVWNMDSDIFYASGTTGNEIGEWRAQFGDDAVTLIEIDQSRYDSHQGKECFGLENTVYTHCGIDQSRHGRSAFEAQRRTRGYCTNGTAYRVDYTRKSGDPNTSVGNTIINGVVCAGVLKGLGYKPKMVVLGDDGLVVLRGRLQIDRNLISGLYTQLGFNAKVKVSHSWAEVEFCSSLFWPVEGGYFLGPKIGRRLPKTGFNLRHLDDSEVKGMLLGLKFETGTLPCFSTYTKHCLGLLKKVKKKDYYDPESRYKIRVDTSPVANTDTEAFFLERYGITVAVAEGALGDALTTARTVRYMVNWPLLTEVFVPVDC